MSAVLLPTTLMTGARRFDALRSLVVPSRATNRAALPGLGVSPTLTIGAGLLPLLGVSSASPPRASLPPLLVLAWRPRLIVAGRFRGGGGFIPGTLPPLLNLLLPQFVVGAG